MKISTILFDYGSVLVRMKDESPRIALADRCGITLDQLYRAVFDSPTAFPACLGEVTCADHWQAVLLALKLPLADQEAFLQQFWSADDLNHELVAYIREHLHGRYRIGLLSNAWDDLREILTQRWGIADLFDALIISAEVGAAKPDETIYRLALDRLHARPGETIFIDDVLANVEAARAVGIHAHHFHGNDLLFEELRTLGV